MKRESWSSNLGFILASVGSAIGLGNIWRFGYMAYTNGGGAFLIPYIIALFCVGISLMILEFGVGHYTRKSAPLALEKLYRGSEWAGWFAVISGFIITSYYTVIIAWCFYYLIMLIIGGYPADPNAYFFNDILHLSSGVENVGGIAYGVLASTLIIWGTIAAIISAGVKNGLEKANKIMMPTLFVLVVILALNALTLPGASTGIEWYLTPDFSALLDYKVWLSAFSQIFFTLSLGFGILIAYASYLPKKSDITTNAFTVSLLNCGFSFLAGFAVFGTLGYMSYTSGVPLSEVVSQGVGLAFVTFPEALSLLPFAIWLFGGDKLREYINKLSEIKIGAWWKYITGVFSPIILAIVVLLDAFNVLTTGYGGYNMTYVLLGASIIPLAFILSMILQKIKTTNIE